jgi:two-component system, NtrC family, sensor kinase
LGETPAPFFLAGYIPLVQNIECDYSTTWRIPQSTSGIKRMACKSLYISNLYQPFPQHSGHPLAYKLLIQRVLLSGGAEIVHMNGFPVPFKSTATLILSGIIVFIGIANLRDRAYRTEPTDGIYWEEANGSVQAAVIDAGGPGNLAGISVGDRLLSVNDHAVGNLGDYYNSIYELGSGASASYQLENGSNIRMAAVQLGSKALLTSRDLLRTVLAFLHLGIGIFVLLRGARLPRAFHFYFICLAAFVIWSFSYTTSFGLTDFLVYSLNILAFLFLPALFAHFCLRFPIAASAGEKRIVLLYAPAILLFLLRLLWITGHLASVGLPRTEHSNEILDHTELVYFCAGLLISGILLLKRRIEVQNLVARQQMKWVSYGTLAGVIPFSLFYGLPVLFGARSTFAMNASILFLSLIPLSIGYALVHYRLMDVEVIARRSAAYFISSSMLLALYLLFVLVLGRALQVIAPQADFIAICFAVLAIALLFAPLRNAVQVRLDRLFYKDQFEDRSSLLDFARTLGSEISLMPLSRSILERISKTFLFERAAIFLTDPVQEDVFCLVHVLNFEMDPEESIRYRENELVDREKPDMLLDNQQEAGLLRRANSALLKKKLYYMLDLKLHGKQVGMIALGRLPQGIHLSTEDLKLLSALADYAAMALENAQLYRSIETKALELERLKAYTESIIESVNVAVLALDFDGRITSCNRAFEDLYGAARQQIAGSLVEALFPPDVIASIQRIRGTRGWELNAPGNIYKFYLENRLGQRLIVNLSLIPLLDPLALSTGALIVLDNITEKVKLEDQLLQAEKLSSIGLLAAGIAHEVNTPIAGISSYTQMLLKDTPSSDKRKSILEKIERQTFRAAEIVNGLLSFSRLSGSEFKEVDINQLIDESLNLLGHQLQLNRIKVDSRFDRSLPAVYGNLGKLQQVFINLFLNARDAMPSGGELEIQTGMNESMIVVDISDTGTGIPEEDLKRIFDPFYTTKPIGKGTGLGLAVSYGIIQEHGGRIFVDSSVGKGTHFRLKLPTRLN